MSALRALAGLIVSGVSDPKRLEVDLVHTGDPIALELVLRLPCEAGVRVAVRRDGEPVAHAFEGESVTVRLALQTGDRPRLSVEG